ncbi:fructose-bisphosphate aldolase [Ktedonobacter sp. SOSP1-85]|uniref:class I fructose-bisphosphate aldolase n=1 Tax=Ktedonobacter sp. SOSP1-85 TaxID=2778367 RepID=UPI0019154743|nr:class I fructose-bisphosphate aldolase [Ktedonobacter sp. SOSP1-85]GHO78306.1 fructose-bisphosphate aldolase [Ktedonobacter sp. SOSP1-85]
MKERVREILSWYANENPGVRTNLARILNHGKLGGTGKLLILPVDQGFEIGPVRSFAPNPEAYDPRYHFQFAIDAGFSAYAAPIGFLEAGVSDYCGEIPLILKCNSMDSLQSGNEFKSTITSTVESALRLGCVGIGFTIYTGSTLRSEMYEQLSEFAAQAKAAGLAVVVWSYPFGINLEREEWRSVDTTAYTTHIAAQIGAHIIKVLFPTSRVEQTAAKETYQQYQIPVEDPADRIRHIVQAAFNGRRLVIFSGGPFNDEEQLLAQARAIRAGGGFGSIIGRNSFQRKKEDAQKLINRLIDIYADEEKHEHPL